ncbi:MAG: NmrA family NAD(P)-binding protein [Phyllobacteriaceae bacterium]|nr:NmrA family NAD(P)-binding protein [Phyllobacteriaceae bacterium]
MKTIAIIGAAGRLGDAAARAFLAAGWRVRGIGRGGRVNEMAPGVEPVVADINDCAALVRAVAGADVVMNAANPPYDKWDGTVLPMAENILEAARAANATHLLPGNVYNFGFAVAMDMTEDTLERSDTEKGKIRIALEALCKRYADEHNVQTIVLRGGDFFGGGKPGSWLDLILLKDVKKDVFTAAGPDGVAHAFAYLPDMADAFVRLAEKRDSLDHFARFHFPGHTLTSAQFHAAAQKAVGRKLAFKHVNWTLLKLVGLFMPVLREVVKMNYLWRAPHSLAGAKLDGAIGPLRITPIEQAIAESVAALGLDKAAEKRAA